MKEIIIDAASRQTRVALLENKELTEIYIEKQSNERITGNIYKGRVENVLPGMQAAFVDIGLDKNAFLYVKDALPNTYFDEDDEYVNPAQYKDYQIDELLKPGQEIMVQIMKEPIDSKGARVTTHITLPGRFVVLMPTVEYIGISRRIESDELREKLKKTAEELKPKGMGLIVRTAAEDCTPQDISNDINFLLKLWDNIKQKQKTGEIPRIVHKDMSIVYRTVRDMFTKDIDRLVINNKEHYEKIREMSVMISPHLKNRVEYYSKDHDIFEHFQVEAQVSKIINRKVWLKCGGYIVIDQTEALTSIDVNTGKFVGTVDLKDTVLKTNTEAAREIAKQLRLRDIGGIIIIDFIDMPDTENENAVIEALKNALKKDRTRTNVLGMTQLGLLEMTRKKVRQRIEKVLLAPCPYCKGEGRILSSETIVKKIEKEVNSLFLNARPLAVYLEIHPDVEELINYYMNEDMIELGKNYKKPVFIKTSTELHREGYSVRGIGMTDITELRKSGCREL
ncbi:MAG TPA: Rne/Rng family ribonuclease, partial [Negativicutes bacterium]|nr:Rne/Rng family ribonuclease [Negativicutes bacterium]